VFARVGEIRGGADRFPQRGPIYAELVLMLRDRGDLLARLMRPFTSAKLRTLSDEEVAVRLRTDLEREPAPEGRRLAVSAMRSSTGRRAPVTLTLAGADGELPRVAAAADEARDVFARLLLPDGRHVFYNVDTTHRPGLPEIQARVDRERAAELAI